MKKRAKIAEVFKLAKPHLWNGLNGVGLNGGFAPPGTEEYLCYAIRCVFVHADVDMIEPIEQAQQIVLNRLGDHASVEGWLGNKGCLDGLPSDKSFITRQVQLYRHRWLDSLIEEFSADTDDLGELWDADPDCEHDIKPAFGGGVNCTKCGGWFCF